MKETPFDLDIDASAPIVKTFRHYRGTRWVCSCGRKFDGDDCVCPLARDTEESVKDVHVVTESPVLKEFSIRFRSPSTMTGLGINGFHRQMVEKYITGTGEAGKPGYTAPSLLIGARGAPVILNEDATWILSILTKTQFPDTPQDLYTFEELAAFGISDSIMRQFYDASTAIQIGEEDGSPLAVAAGQ